MESVISIKNVSFAYENTLVLKDVSLDIAAGDFIGIIGPNGGGKTTLLKLLLGMHKPRNGSITIMGKKPSEVKKHIGYVPQYSTMDNRFPISAGEVVSLGLSNSSSFLPWLNKKDKEQTITIMDKLGITDLFNLQFGELSGGQKQRCLIARALVGNPSILFLDEPTASVDPTVETDIYELLKTINRDITILLVSHDMSFISAYVNKIACVNQSIIVNNSEDVSETAVAEHGYHSHTNIIKHSCGL